MTTPDTPHVPDRPDLADDDVLVGLVARVLDTVESAPADALAMAYGASAMRGFDDELAELVFDSRDERELVVMRGTDTDTRLMSFANDHHTIDLELHADGRTIVGQIVPAPVDDVVELESDDATTVVVALDDRGRFRIAAPHGALRLRIVGRMVTPWITR